MSSIEAQLELEHVTVFQSSAMFKMRGVFKCMEGENTIIVDNLTRKLDKNSVRIKGTGHGRIANILIEKIYSEELDKEEIKKLIIERDELVIKKKEIQDKKKNLQNSMGKKELATETFANEFPKWYSLGKIKIEEIKELDSLFNEQIDDISRELRNLDVEGKKIQIKIDGITSKINQLGYSTHREINSFYRIVVILEAENASDFTLELSFMVTDSYWTPFYDIVIKEQGNVQISLMANIYNQTEIDWTDIGLDISTASVQPVRMDKPNPFNIDVYKPIFRGRNGARRTSKPLMRTAPMNFVAQREVEEEEMDLLEATPEAPPPPELKTIETSVSSNFGVQVYNLKAKYSIKSDKNPKPIPLFKQELPSLKQYFWSATSPDRILCNNKIKNGKNLILPGSAKVYVEDEFIGETELELISPNEEFKLGERISYDVKVKKEMKAKVKSKEGTFKGKTAVNYKFEILIENLNNVEEELILYDRVPHSVSEKIKVKINDVSDEPDSNVMNVLKYVVDMRNVKEKKVISYGYEVIYEKDINITPSLP
ncbi:MAG: mucoidy inhibitor MuiA family protein [Promethearchaeota archaeon]